MSRVIVITILTAAAVGGALPMSMAAEPLADYTAQTIIDGDVGLNAQGVLGVNMAAGDSNLQSNATAFSLADGPVVARTTVVQSIDSGQFTTPAVAVTKIDGNAFSNAAGAIGINQAAGAANAQANSVAVAIGSGPVVAADAELAQSVTGATLATMATTGQYREATVADSAFSGVRGIVQVNQAAGSANVTGNSFALRIQLPGGTQ